MDIQKLEKLSCLKLEEKDKESLQYSLDGVFQMMSDLDKIEMPLITKKDLEETHFRQKNESEEFFSKEKKVDGLHKEEIFFLAPKVIKK